MSNDYAYNLASLLDAYECAGEAGTAEIDGRTLAEWRSALIAENARATAAEAERDEARAHVDALREKVEPTDCGCAYDRAGDVCLLHSPALDAALARATAAEAEMDAAIFRAEQAEALLANYDPNDEFWAKVKTYWKGTAETARRELSEALARATAAEAEAAKLRRLVECLIENDPNDDAADGVSVLDVWRKEASAALSALSETGR